MEIRIVADRSGEVLSALEAAIPRLLEEIGLHLEGEAKDELENPPRRIDTHTLQDSISHRTNSGEKAVYIGTNVEYAIYVHEGTRKMTANRFLRNAMEKNADQIKSKIEAALRSC